MKWISYYITRCISSNAWFVYIYISPRPANQPTPRATNHGRAAPILRPRTPALMDRDPRWPTPDPVCGHAQPFDTALLSHIMIWVSHLAKTLSHFATVLSHFPTVLNHFTTIKSHFVISSIILRTFLSHSSNFAHSFLRFFYSAQSFFDFLSHFLIFSVILWFPWSFCDFCQHS
jgi:hypothetical protein